MKNALILGLMFVSLSECVSAQTGTEVFKKYFRIDKTKTVDEFTVKEAMLQLSPKGTQFKKVIKKLEDLGIYFHPKNKTPLICFPADNTPLHCQFKSSKELQGTEPNYTVDYIFDAENRVKDVVAVRNYSGRVKRYTTNPTQPSLDILLRDNLSSSSKIKEFDSVYGEGQIEEGPDVPDDWPLSILYFDDKTKKYFYVGVDVGNMSWNDLNMLKKNRKLLNEYKVGIIYVVNGR